MRSSALAIPIRTRFEDGSRAMENNSERTLVLLDEAVVEEEEGVSGSKWSISSRITRLSKGSIVS